MTIFLNQPSETGAQFIFGFSPVRLAVGLVFALLLCINLLAVVLASKLRWKWQENFELVLTKTVSKRIGIFLSFLYSVAIASGILLLAVIPPMVRAFNFLEPVRVRMTSLLVWLLLASILLITLLRILYANVARVKETVDNLNWLSLLIGIFISVFFLYEHLLIWMGGANQSRYAYFNLLADQFLKGKLFLAHPSETHDLVLHNGKWYVPMPPGPAIVLLPFAYMIGGENINLSDFSIFLSGLNATLLFMIYEQMLKRGWAKISRVGMLWLVILFAFGTPELWVGMRGRAWFLSQTLAVFFIALSIFATLKSWSPWVIGGSLGLAILSRPNSAMSWLFLLAIALQIWQDETKKAHKLRNIVFWTMQSLVPIGAAVATLLLYNYARFGDYLDFGYTSLNGDPYIVANAKAHGIFSTYFIPGNLQVMLFHLPTIQIGERWPILPSSVGMSVFLVTPPLIYLLCRYEIKWWIVGAWLSVALNIFLLLMYHNTGAHQFGYRYILDFIIPLMMLMAVALAGKIRWHFVLLTLFSVVFNIYGAYWFISG